MFRQLIQPACAVLSWAGAVLMLAFVPSAGMGQFGLDNPLDAAAKHVAFTVNIAPSDPFSDMNQVGLPKDKPLAFQRGDTFLLTITGVPEKGWHTYPLTQRAPEQNLKQLSTLTIEGAAFQPIYPVRESAPEWKDDRKDPNSLEDVYLEHARPFTWTQEIYIKRSAPPGPTDLSIKIRAQVCSDGVGGQCIFEDYRLTAPLTIASGEPLPPTADLTKRLTVSRPQPIVVPLPKSVEKAGQPSKPSPDGNKDATSKAVTPGLTRKPKVDAGLVASVVNAILGGLVSLLTPCVFPMIPITVSYFLKQSEKRKVAPARVLSSGMEREIASANPTSQPTPHSALVLAAVYSGTIVLVLAAGGLALLQVLQEVSSHYITNFVLGAVFLFFALSLLGMYDITLPSWLQDRTARGESKGGLVGVFFMALTFSIISFACVGPIYGGFITLQASGQSGSGGFWKAVPPVLGFSMAFASPFFLLALFPSLLHSMPRAGSWMNSVKVVLGFLELAAVVKFLRAGELVLTKTSSILTFDLSLGIYIALALACGLYLLGVYRLPHDHDAPESIGIPRLMFSLTFITLSIYLVPGLFKTADGDAQRPRGQVYSWIESFLLPETEGPSATSVKRDGGAHPKLVWHSNLKEALSEAERNKKLVLIDFTGLACTNCRKNERDVFSRPDVQELLAQHVLVKLYAEAGVPDGVHQDPDAAETVEMRNKVFESNALPLYALVRPKGDSFDIVRKDTQGLITDIPAFIQFLAKE